MADVPDFYSDSFRLSMNPWGVSLIFGTLPMDQPEGEEQTNQPETKAIVRMSQLHAKIMAILMRRVLKDVERRQGEEITIPANLSQAFEIMPTDWD